MTSTRMEGEPPGYKFTCDTCRGAKTQLLTGQTAWPLAVGAVRAAGWHVQRQGEGYGHLCPACVARAAAPAPRARLGLRYAAGAAQ